MNRRDFLKQAGAASVLAVYGCQTAANVSSQSARPNVLIINIDDMGYGDLSCHGNPAVKTPNIDKLYRESVRFTQFHVAPMCTPTRSQLLTGVDALRNGARWVGTENTHLRADIPTMAEMFRDAGYATGFFGKWHIGDNYPYRPQDRGFQETLWFPQQEVGTVNDWWGNDYFDDTYQHNGKPAQYKGYCTDVWFRQAIQWIDKQKKAGKPFLCMIPTNVVHGPYFVDQVYRDRFGKPDLNKDVQTFYGMVVNLDDNIGKLDAFLEQSGLKDNTIVIFMTDNGATAGYHTYNAGMKGLKTQLWDGGHRVPLFIRWPNGGLRPSGNIDGLAQVQDILPTLLELCGVPAPAAARFDGISLADVLRGKQELPDRMLVVQFQRRQEIKKWDACILWGPWRLLNLFDIDPLEKDQELIKDIERRRQKYEIRLGLYNIQDDPRQDRNVIDQHPDIVEKMKAFYEQWWAKNEPELHIPRPIIIGNPAENPAFLAAPSWANQYFTQVEDVLSGRPAKGYWNVRVERSGQFRFELRRWPKEADTPIAGKTDIRYTDPFCYGQIREGKALPIVAGRIQIGNFDEQKPIRPDDKACVFETRLPAGDYQLHTEFLDASGKALCSAYYVYVQRL